MLTREELDQERAAWLARRQIAADDAVAKVRAQREALLGDRDWLTNGRRRSPEMQRNICQACGDKFYTQRKAGRPRTLCAECRGSR